MSEVPFRYGGHARRKSCIFSFRSSSSKSELTVACACGHLLACAVVASAAVCRLTSMVELYGEVGVARSRQPVMTMTLATPRRMSFFFVAPSFLSVARLAGGAHVIWVELYRF